MEDNNEPISQKTKLSNTIYEGLFVFDNTIIGVDRRGIFSIVETN